MIAQKRIEKIKKTLGILLLYHEVEIMAQKINIEEIEKVLIVRSCRMNQFYSNLDLLKKWVGRDIIVDVLAQSEIKDKLEGKESINQILAYDEGFFKVKAVSKELWEKIQNKYDAVVILYNAPFYYSKRYNQIEKMASMSKTKYVIGIDINGAMFVVPYKKLWLKRIRNNLIFHSLKCLTTFSGIIITISLLIFISVLFLRGVIKTKIRRFFFTNFVKVKK